MSLAGSIHSVHQPPPFPAKRRPRSRRLARVALAAALAVACAPLATASAGTLTESFDSWPPSNWMRQNNSSPLGAQSQGWFVGTATGATPDPGPFNAFNGADNAYAAANFASTAGGTGTISSWLITPTLSGLTQGDTVSFYTRKPTVGPGQTDFPDRLEVRVSTGGACSPGSTASGVGDFTTLLVSINPTLVTGVYPQAWTQFTATLPPMPPTTGCVGFRYFVTVAGPTGTNSDYIGLDQVEITDQPDNVTPDTTIGSGPSGAVPSNDATFTYAATPAAGVGSYECRLTPEGETAPDFTACSSLAQTYEDLADGSYTFEARGVSHGGNVDPTPASRTFTVDTTPPDTSITSGPSGTIATDDAMFGFAGEPSDDVAGFECRLRSAADDDPAFDDCATATEQSYDELADGAYTFEVRAYDQVGNIDPTPASRTFTVDTTAPETTILTGPSGTVGAEDLTFTYEGTPADDVDRFECRLRTADDDDPVFASCPAEGRTYSDLPSGEYVFEVRAIDAVDNTEIPPAEQAFTVDVTAPSVTIESGPEPASTATAASFAFTAGPEEDVESVECRLVGPGDADPAFAPCPDGTRSYEGLAVGEYRFEVRATDALGNVSQTAQWAFRVEAPTVTPVEPTPTTPAPPTVPALPTSRQPGPPVVVPPPANPQISGLRLLQPSFRAWASGPSFGLVRNARVGEGRGTWLRFQLDRKVRMELRIARQVNRRWQPLRGVITRTAFRGTTQIPVRGRFRGKTLRPGTYRLSVTLVDAVTGTKTTEQRTFRIRG